MDSHSDDDFVIAAIMSEEESPGDGEVGCATILLVIFLVVWLGCMANGLCQG